LVDHRWAVCPICRRTNIGRLSEGTALNFLGQIRLEELPECKAALGRDVGRCRENILLDSQRRSIEPALQ
jgi:hypothetical protein